jgi:DNA-binding protein Fis
MTVQELPGPAAPERDPAAVIAAMPLEELVYQRLRVFIDQHADVPTEGLHALVMPHVERALFRLAMERADGHRGRAARMLGLNRNTLTRRLRELGLEE